MSVVQWEIDDLALYVPPERGGGGARRVRVASAAFMVEDESRPMRTVAFLDERGRRYDVLEAHLARCDAEFRLIGEPPAHLQVRGGPRWDHWFDPAQPDAEAIAWPEAPSGDAGLTDRHVQALDEAEAAREASKQAIRRRDTETARNESKRATGLVLKVEFDLADRAAQLDAERRKAEVEALTDIRRQVADADAKRRSERLSAGRPLGDAISIEPEACPVVVETEVDEEYLAVMGKGIQVRKRRVRRLRVMTEDGLFAMHESGRLTDADVEACLRYRALFKATERGVRSSMNMDRTGGMAEGAEERKAAQWADRLEIERRARDHPARNGFEIMALEEICGQGRCVNDLVRGGHKREKLARALERVTDVILGWLKETR